MTTVLVTYSDQADALEKLKVEVSRERYANLSQALNQAFDGNGKDSGRHAVAGHGTVQILHASAGKTDVSSVTLFYFLSSGGLNLIALGEHEGNRYRIDSALGQDQMPFRKGRLVGVDGS